MLPSAHNRALTPAEHAMFEARRARLKRFSDAAAAANVLPAPEAPIAPAEVAPIAPAEVAPIDPIEPAPVIPETVVDEPVRQAPPMLTGRVHVIQRAVAEHFGIPVEQIPAVTRARCITLPRQVAVYLTRIMLPCLSLEQIGRRFGNRDHTTIIYATQKIQTQIETNSGFAEEVALIKLEIEAALSARVTPASSNATESK